MSGRSYGPEEKKKLERIIREGVDVLQEIEDLQGGMKDTVKAVAEELDVKPSLINKAIKIAKNRDWGQQNADFEELEAIVSITGYDKV
jgi:transposase-like protein